MRSVSCAAPLRVRRVAVRRGRIDEGRRGDALRQKLEVENADSGTDVEQGVAVPQLVGDGLEQQPRRRVGTFLPVAFPITRSNGRPELTLGLGVRRSSATIHNP